MAESKYAVMFGYLVLVTDRHDCGFGDYGVHEPHCGQEPVAKISEIEKFFSVGIEERYEKALRDLISGLDSDLYGALETDEHTGVDHFPQMAHEFRQMVERTYD